MSLRLAIYSLVIGYIAADLFWFHGPIWKRTNAPAHVVSSDVVARVFGHQITRSQVERQARENLWLVGKNYDKLPASEKKIVRYAALNDLLDHELLRVKATANANTLQVSKEEIDARLLRFASRFQTRSDMEKTTREQGIGDETALRDRLAAQIQQEKYVESKIAPLAVVSDEEAREFFQQHKDTFVQPEAREVRHIFMASLDHPDAEAKPIMEATLNSIEQGSTTFQAAAAAISEDPHSKAKGGNLGWMDRSHMPQDLVEKVFAMPLNEPRMIKSKLGWHILEVTAKRDAKLRGFHEVKDEIALTLTTAKRAKAIAEYRDALRKFESEKIEVFHERMEW